MRKLRHIFGIHFPFGLQRPCFSASLLIAVFFLSLNQVVGKFDMLENWGFDQGGEAGFRQGNFVAEDAELIVTKMSLNEGGNMLAVAGAHETDWAVRIYDLSTGQPEAFISWTGGLDLNHSIVSSLAWAKNNGHLIIGVEHLGDGKANAVTLVQLKPHGETQEVQTFLLNNWTMISEIQSDRLIRDTVWLLGMKDRKAIVQTLDTERMELKPGITTAEDVIKPKSLIVDENQIWIAGENADGNAVVEAVGMDTFTIPHDSHISAMVKTGSNSILQKSEHLMGHWKFDGNAEDSSANQNHGEMVGGRFRPDRKGKPSSALFLDGVDDQVVIKHSDSLNPVDQLSISMWLKCENLVTKWAPILQKGGAFRNSGKNREYSVHFNRNTSLHLIAAGNLGKKTEERHNTLSSPANEWFHFGATLDRINQVAKIFLNGQLLVFDKDKYTGFNNNTDDLFIGSSPTVETISSFSNFHGFIDDLRLYNVALQQWQFEKSMNPGNFSQNKQHADNKFKSLMGHWKFDSNAKDSSDNENHGQMIGGKFVTDRQGNPESAVFLNGVDDQVVIKHSDSLNPVDQLSISMWLKCENLVTKWAPILHKGGAFRNSGKNREYSVHFNRNTSLHLIAAGNLGKKTEERHNTLSSPANEWFHFGATLDRINQVAKIFLNGQLLVSGKDKYTGFNNNTDDLFIGSSPTVETISSFSNFHGSIDDLRLYHVALGSYEFDRIVNGENSINSSLKIFISGNESHGDSFENVFLKCMELDSQSNIQVEWESSSRKTTGKREWGADLLSLNDGSVIMSGNFKRPWLLGENENTGSNLNKFAVLTNAGDDENYESFLAKYDGKGNLMWAQTSGMIGNDFSLDLISLDTDFALLLGNRNIDGGFGPYLAKIQLVGNSNNNAELLVNPGSEDEPENIFWNPNKSIRLGEPMSSSNLSARALGGGKFTYELNGKKTFVGDFPFFTPGRLTLKATLMRAEMEANATSIEIEGKKGRVFLKAGYDEISENEVQLWAQLHGIPEVIKGFIDAGKMLEGVRFEKLDGEIIENGRLTWENEFNGILEVLAIFEEDDFFEAATRTISLLIINGKLDSQEDSSMVSLRVHDLDGWQNPRSAPIGSEVGISATQGFGRQKKFERWVEFSEQSEGLRTARVQDPFNLRTSLILENDITLFAKYNFSFVGTAVNGYLRDSKVFLDANFNGLHDDNEPFGYTNQQGEFTIDFGESDSGFIDKNGDGEIDQTEAMLVTIGGHDTASSLGMEVSFRAPPNYTVLSSITTLVSEIAETGVSLDESEKLVSSVLELPHAIELSSFEPLDAVLYESELSKKSVLRSTQLANLYNEGARYIETVTGNQVGRIEAGEIIVESLGDLLTQNKLNVNQGGINLTDKQTLASIMDQAVDIAQSKSEASQDVATIKTNSRLSARTKLSIAQPVLAEVGNNLMTDQLMENVAAANRTLEDLSSDTSLEATDFKSLASSVQSELNSLGDKAAATLLNEEVSALQALQGDELNDGIQVLAVTDRVKSVAEIEVEHKIEISEVFNLTALSQLSQQANTNIFAPVLGVMRIVAPAELENNQIIGTFAAFDPEGGGVTYSFVDGNPDLDEDGTPLLSIEQNNGRVRILDIDDLSLLGFSFVEPTLRVYDESELYSEHSVYVDLTEWGYQSGKPYLSIKSLEIQENQPLGTSLGKLQVLGSSGKPVPGNPSFQLLGIEGDDDLLKRRSLGPALVLNRDGTLQSGRVLDFENSSSYIVRLRITDDEGLFMETSVEVKVLDEFKPIVRTLKDLPAQDGFETEIFVEKNSILGQSPMIKKDTPVAHLKPFLSDGSVLSASHEFEILGDESSPNYAEDLYVKEWISLNPKLDEISSISNPQKKVFSLILENLEVDAINAPDWLSSTKAPAWFVLLRRSYAGKVNEAFTKFDSANMYGYVSQFFPFDGTSLVTGKRFISFPSDLIRKGNGSNWASSKILPSSSQLISKNDLDEWLGNDELDLAIYIEDFSVQPKRVFEKRFPFGKIEKLVDLAELNEANPAFILKPDGTLITGRDIQVSEKNTWNYKIRMNGPNIGYKDTTLKIVADGSTLDPFEFIAENEVKKHTGKLRIMGKLYASDTSNANTDVGFLISSSPNPEISDAEVEVISLSKQDGVFEHYLTLHSNYHKKYYRAYAINGEGVSYGASYRVNVPKSILSMNWTDSTALPSTPGWWNSPWLGEFFRLNDSDWIFHAELGWVYLVTKNKVGGVWLWQEKLGWVWTNSNLYPFLFSSSSNRWIFFHGQSKGNLILYDYEASNWVTVEI